MCKKIIIFEECNIFFDSYKERENVIKHLNEIARNKRKVEIKNK